MDNDKIEHKSILSDNTLLLDKDYNLITILVFFTNLFKVKWIKTYYKLFFITKNKKDDDRRFLIFISLKQFMFVYK